MKNDDLFVGFQLALKYKVVIFGALKKARIYETRNDYPDYFHEGMIAYARCYEVYDKTNFDVDRFNNYAFTKVVWKCMDQLRREKMRKEYHLLNNFEDLEFGKDDEVSFIELTYGIEFTDLELLIFKQHFIDGQSLAELATTVELSPRYLRKVRTKLRDKLSANYLGNSEEE